MVVAVAVGMGTVEAVAVGMGTVEAVAVGMGTVEAVAAAETEGLVGRDVMLACAQVDPPEVGRLCAGYSTLWTSH